MKLILLGPPGAGKGTMAVRAKKYFGIPHISTGDLFRNAITNETKLGKQVKSILASGGLVPDSVTIAMVKERLDKQDCKKGFILDGFPRTTAQAEALSELTDIDTVLNFVVAEDIVVKRLSGRRMCKSTGKIYHIIFNPPKVEGKDDETGEDLYQRADDQKDAILHRLEVYKSQTEPLIAFYREKGLVKDVDVSATPDEAFEKAKEALNA